jgi:hypothetical protein
MRKAAVGDSLVCRLWWIRRRVEQATGKASLGFGAAAASPAAVRHQSTPVTPDSRCPPTRHAGPSAALPQVVNA